jgi:hypothetical protein
VADMPCNSLVWLQDGYAGGGDSQWNARCPGVPLQKGIGSTMPRKLLTDAFVAGDRCLPRKGDNRIEW